jgi:hypothetical protein
VRLGIMQPYIFPYIGYFQLINAVDKFVVYDDVNYIKQGWVNRNKILLNQKEFLFTVPLKDASSFKKIFEVELNSNLYFSWKEKFKKTIIQAYSKAPFFNDGLNIITSVIDAKYNNIAELARASILNVCDYLSIKPQFVSSSAIYENNYLSSQNRVIDICLREKATTYINAKGGMALYSKDDFEIKKLELKFISSDPISYSQSGENFVPWLSIIDVIMFNDIETIKGFLKDFSYA